MKDQGTGQGLGGVSASGANIATANILKYIGWVVADSSVGACLAAAIMLAFLLILASNTA